MIGYHSPEYAHYSLPASLNRVYAYSESQLSVKIPARIGYLDDRPTWRMLSLDGRFRVALASQFLERLSNWALTIALVILVYELTERLAVVAGLMVLLVAPRLVAPWLVGQLSRGDACRIVSWLSLARGPLILALLFVTASDDLYWAAVIVGALGLSTALLDELHGDALPRLTPHSRLPALNVLLGRMEQFAMIAAAGLVAALLAIGDVRLALIAAVVACFGAWLFVTIDRRDWQEQTPSATSRPVVGTSRHGRVRPEVLIVAAGLFAGALVGMGLRVALIEVVVAELALASFAYALLLGVVGLGAVFGPPLPVPRLLGRVPVSALIGLSLLLLAGAAAVIGIAASAMVIIGTLFLCGVLAVTVDLVAATAARYAVSGSEIPDAFRLLAGAVIAGQLLALALVGGLSHIWNVAAVLFSVSLLALGVGATVIVLSLLSDRQPA